MKVHHIGFGTFVNHDESLHFTPNDDGLFVCWETGALMKEVCRDENDIVVEIEYMTSTDLTVLQMYNEAMAKRQPCKSLIDEIMEGANEDDDDDGY